MFFYPAIAPVLDEQSGLNASRRVLLEIRPAAAAPE
jgi:hypothetical protein